MLKKLKTSCFSASEIRESHQCTGVLHNNLADFVPPSSSSPSYQSLRLSCWPSGNFNLASGDIILTPRLDYLNATKLSEVGNVSAMPRHRAYMAVNSASNVVGWFMDFKLEKQNHLGTIGGDEPDNHSYIYAHESIGLVKGQQARISFLS
jgi:hypothetical protein